ncbi:MAG: oxalurate catabolism protein HpxZ [Gammaproteobacteria bacterium]|nr:oxalurate catabolism protein HpxZ [Gammaproteobacteria bacterium]
MEINSPEVHAEITVAFRRYVQALTDNDIDTVKALFWNSEHTLRYGTGENLYGMNAINAFRDGQRGQGIDLDITRLVITTFGRDFATANCEMKRLDLGMNCRMSHSWVRFTEGWRIVAAHVSFGPQ